MQIAASFLESAEAVTRLTPITTTRISDDINLAKALVKTRTDAVAAYNAAVTTASQKQSAYNQAVANEATPTAVLQAANRVAQAVAAMISAHAQVIQATTAALNAAKARDAYALSQKFVAYRQAQSYGAANHAGAVLATANVQSAATQTTVASGYLNDMNVPATQRQARQVAQLFQALLNQPPLLTELNFWNGKLAGGMSVAEVAAGILASPAGLAKFPSSMSNDAFVTQLYRFGLDRDFSTDPVGLRYWSDQLGGAAPMTRAQLAAKWVNDVSLARNPDAAKFNTRSAATLQATVNESQSGPNLLPAILLAEADAKLTASAYGSAGKAKLAASQPASTIQQIAGAALRHRV